MKAAPSDKVLANKLFIALEKRNHDVAVLKKKIFKLKTIIKSARIANEDDIELANEILEAGIEKDKR